MSDKSGKSGKAAEDAFDIDDMERRMDGALAALRSEFSGLRTGRASAGLLESVRVEAYGQSMPLNQLASISVLDARTLSVQVWDREQVAAVEKAILSADLGVNPQTEGQVMRIPVPPLSEERRKELTRLAAKAAEQARIAIRNIRRDGMEQLRALEKNGAISQDEQRARSNDIQKRTDAHIAGIDELLATKEREVMQV